MDIDVLRKLQESKLIVDKLNYLFNKKYSNNLLNEKIIIESLNSSFVALEIPFIISASKRSSIIYFIKKFLKYFLNLSIFVYQYLLRLEKNNSNKCDFYKLEIENIYICSSNYILRETLLPLFINQKSKKKILFSKDRNLIFSNQKDSNMKLRYKITFNDFRNLIKIQIILFKNLIKNRFLFKENLNFIQLINIYIALLSESFIAFEAYYDFMYIRRFFKIKNKNLKLFTADVACPYTRTMVEIFNKEKFNTIIFQFGIYGIHGFEWIYCNSMNIFVWGAKYKDLIYKFIENKKIKIHITGTPRFDYIYNKKSIKEKNKRLNSHNKKSILFLSSYGHRSYNALFKGFNENLRSSKIELLEFFKNSNLNLDIKPHPLEKEELRIYNNFNNVNVIPSNCDIRELLLNYDFVITYGSTLAYDCILQGIKTLIYRPKKVAWYPNVFSNKKLFPVIKDTDELNEFLQKKINNKKGNKNYENLKNHVYKLGESNLDYILKKISKL